MPPPEPSTAVSFLPSADEQHAFQDPAGALVSAQVLPEYAEIGRSISRPPTVALAIALRFGIRTGIYNLNACPWLAWAFFVIITPLCAISSSFFGLFISMLFLKLLCLSFAAPIECRGTFRGPNAH
jgi:hypothetical protein